MDISAVWWTSTWLSCSATVSCARQVTKGMTLFDVEYRCCTWMKWIEMRQRSKRKGKKKRPQIQWKVTWEEEVKRRGIWSTNKCNRLIFKWPFVLPHFRLCRIEQSIETELADKAAILARIFMTPTELTDFQWPIYFPSPSLGSFDVFILFRTLFCSLGRVVNSNIKARGCR